MIWTRIKLIWLRLNRKVRRDFLVLLGLFGVTGIICWTAWIFDRPPQDAKETAIEGIDTYIPKGMVLVPIEIQNLESLDSVFGQKGLADLYWVGREGRSAQAAARRVALFRAPLNPRQFAVLVPESMAAPLVRTGGAFHVVLLNPNLPSSGRPIAEHQSRPKRIRVLGDVEPEAEEEKNAQP